MTDILKRHWLPMLAFAAMAAASLYAWGRVPESLPVHWGLSGEPDRYGSRLEALWFVPGLALLLYALLGVLPRFDKDGERNRAVLEGSRTALALGMTALHLGLVAGHLGWEVSVTRLVSLTVGAILLLVGNVLPKAQPSRFVGLRTPWTYGSKEAWYKAQRWSGWTLTLTGAALIAAGLITDSGLVMLAILLSMALAMVGVTVYAYRVWKRDEAREQAL